MGIRGSPGPPAAAGGGGGRPGPVGGNPGGGLLRSGRAKSPEGICVGAVGQFDMT